MLTKNDAVLIAVAMGEAGPAAQARLDAAFPDPPAPGSKTIIGLRSERREGKRFEVDLFADGTEGPEREVQNDA